MHAPTRGTSLVFGYAASGGRERRKRCEQVTGAAPTVTMALVGRSLRDGELKGLREALLRLVDRAGIPLTEDDRARIRGIRTVDPILARCAPSP